MNKKIKKAFTIIGILVIVGFGIWMHLVYSEVPELKPNTIIKKVHSELLNESIYLRKESRGLNYDVTTITKNSQYQYKPNPKEDYVYGSSGTPIFFNLTGDTLIVYTYTLAKTPSQMTTKFKIKQIELNRFAIDSLFKSYKHKGLDILL